MFAFICSEWESSSRFGMKCNCFKILLLYFFKQHVLSFLICVVRDVNKIAGCISDLGQYRCKLLSLTIACKEM